MKRIIMLVVLLGTLFAANATGYNARQEALITSIQKYLSSQGYTPERVDDGLKFKSEGVTYFVEVSEEDTNPMYVRLSRYIKFDDKVKREAVMEKLMDYNSYLAVKAYCKEKNLILTSDMFVTSADQFTVAFGDLLSLMKKTADKINK